LTDIVEYVNFLIVTAVDFRARPSENHEDIRGKSGASKDWQAS
jgi:hypothetical protein